MLIFSGDVLRTYLPFSRYMAARLSPEPGNINADTGSCGLRFSDDVLRLAAMDVEAKANG